VNRTSAKLGSSDLMLSEILFLSRLAEYVLGQLRRYEMVVMLTGKIGEQIEIWQGISKVFFPACPPIKDEIWLSHREEESRGWILHV